jgi:hypothetical protein
MTSNGNSQSHWIPAFAGMTSKNNGERNGKVTGFPLSRE